MKTTMIVIAAVCVCIVYGAGPVIKTRPLKAWIGRSSFDISGVRGGALASQNTNLLATNNRGDVAGVVSNSNALSDGYSAVINDATATVDRRGRQLATDNTVGVAHGRRQGSVSKWSATSAGTRPW